MKQAARLLITAMLVTGFAAAALAGTVSVTKDIKVTYKGIAIMVNGQRVASPVEPFILTQQGVTMVPIRLVSEALRQKVTWDPDKAVIAIDTMKTSSIPDAAPAPEVGPPAPSPQPAAPKQLFIEALPVLRNIGPFYQREGRPFVIASRKFVNGVAVELQRNRSLALLADPGAQAEMVIDLYGKYSQARGYLGVEDDSRNSRGAFNITIYGDDRLIYRGNTMRPSEYPQPFYLSLEGVYRLKVVAQWQEGSTLGDHDRVMVVLADTIFVPVQAQQ